MMKCGIMRAKRGERKCEGTFTEVGSAVGLTAANVSE